MITFRMFKFNQGNINQELNVNKNGYCLSFTIFSVPINYFTNIYCYLCIKHQKLDVKKYKYLKKQKFFDTHVFTSKSFIFSIQIVRYFMGK